MSLPRSSEDRVADPARPGRRTRGLVIESFDDAPHLAAVPIPALGPTQVLVGVRAASINAFDWKAAEGVFRKMFEYRFPVTIGRDYAGVVEAVGDQVTRVAVGDEVFGYFTGTQLHRGSYADHVWLDEDDCFVAKPAALDHVTAACLPLCGIVAMRCVDAVAPRPGDVVAVLGAPGGVGSFAVQLAAARGAHVVATGLVEDEEHLVGLGAAEVVWPGASLIPTIAELHADGIAGLIDLVHYRDDFTEHVELLADGGRAASLHRAVDDEALAARGVTGTNVTSMPDPRLLERLGALAARGELRVPIRRTLPLEEAADGLLALKQEHARGKLVITMGQPQNGEQR